MSTSENNHKTENDSFSTGRLYVGFVTCIIIILSFTCQCFVMSAHLSDLNFNKTVILGLFNIL
ncbi:hypothetical protein BB558_002924, partial [Smittium angustum]